MPYEILDTITVNEQMERTSEALLPLHRHMRLQHSEVQSAEEVEGGYVNLVSRLLNEQGMPPFGGDAVPAQAGAVEANTGR